MTESIPFRWRSIALPAFLPTLLFSIGEGAIIPIIPIVADDMGATIAIAGLVASMIMVGSLIGDIPSGWLVSRIGERTSMIGASLVAILGLVVCTYAPNTWVLGIGVLVIGIAAAVFALARHAFMTSFVPVAFRARSLSTLGGTFRLGFFVGPFISAAVIHLTGSTSSVFWIHIVGCLGAAVVLLLLPDPAATFGASRRHTPGEVFVGREAHGLFRTMRRSRGLLLTLGTGGGLVGGIRAARAVILPLWAVSIGVSDANTAIIIGVAGAIDFALFYTSGQIMDRFGVLWSAVPSMVGLGIGHLVLAFTQQLPDAVVWFISVTMFLALANGIGSGILMTLGAHLAPPANPAPFLGAWRFTGDLGGAGAPVLLAAITAVSSLALATGVMGVLGLVGAGMLLRYVPRYMPRNAPPTRR